MRNILYLLPYFNIGGTEIHVVGLLKGIRGYFNFLLATPYGEGISLLEENEIPYKIIPLLTLFNLKAYKKEVKRVLEDFKPDIIHVHGAHELVYVVRRLVPDVPIIFTCHGYPASNPYINYALSAFINKEFSDKVICVSHFDKNELIKRGLSSQKIVVIHNGISEDFQRKELPIKVDGVIIGTCARLSKTKGINYLIEAFSILSKKYKDMSLVIIGDGEERKNLENLAKKLKIKDRIYFLGSLPKAREYIWNFHIFVLPSLFEPFGISILEALSSKVPVVATKVGGIVEIIEDGISGILVPPKDTLSLSYAIERLLLDEDLRKNIAEEGYKKFLENFTARKMVDETVKVYEESLFNSSK